MWLTMWSIIGLIGLLTSFFGSAILAVKLIKKEDTILDEAAPRLPAISEHGGKEEYNNSLRELPHTQALLSQSRVAKCALCIISIGFLLQFSSALVSFIST